MIQTRSLMPLLAMPRSPLSLRSNRLLIRSQFDGDETAGTWTTGSSIVNLVPFPMSLAGFTKTFDSKGLDAKAAQQRQDDLNKALQARAEEARKKLIQQQQKEGGGAAPAQ